MATFSYDPEHIVVRLANNESEIRAAQALRYIVFYDEYGAKPSAEMAREKRDIDSYDKITDHLIVLNMALPEGPDRIVGTYRLLRQAIAEQHGPFYTSSEYDITSLLNSGNVLLELGRSCVLPEYRTRPILQKMWEAIAHYVADHDIGLMFGCASLHGTDIDALSYELAYLHHYHLAPTDLRPRALDKHYIDMNRHEQDSFDVRKTFALLPPLIKGYIRLGAHIGDGAVIDYQFNTTDICIVMPTAQVTEKYLRHYERVTQKTMPVNQRATG